MNTSMNGNNLALPFSQNSGRHRRSSVSSMDDFSVGEYRPPVPAKRNVRKSHYTSSDDRELWKLQVQHLEEDLEQYRIKAEKYKVLYDKQRDLCDSRTDELLKLEAKFVQLEKQYEHQEKLIFEMNNEQLKMSEELKEKSKKLGETVEELNAVMMKSDDLAKKLHDFEKQLQISEAARNKELENLRSLQGSFQASERHFASVLEQVQSLIQENEIAYEANSKLTQEKMKVERDLSLKNKISTSLTAELAEAQEKMKQINNTFKFFENEKACLYKKMQEQQALITQLENELEAKNRQLESASQEKCDLEGQLKLANLCLSRALSGKDKANIFPQKSEVRILEAAANSGSLLPSVKALQEELTAKDKCISRLLEENKKLEDEFQKCKMDLQKQQEVNSVNQMWFGNTQGTPSDLHQEIQQRERIIDSLKLTIEKAISDRNRLGLKCLRRKEQAVLLKEKNKVLEEIMLIGNRLYEEGLKKIRNMKLAQENAFGPTLSLVGLVNSGGNQQSASPVCRQLLLCEGGEAMSGVSPEGDSANNSGDSYGCDMVLNI